MLLAPEHKQKQEALRLRERVLAQTDTGKNNLWYIDGIPEITLKRLLNNVYEGSGYSKLIQFKKRDLEVVQEVNELIRTTALKTYDSTTPEYTEKGFGIPPEEMAEYGKKWKIDDEIAEAISQDQEKETNEAHREFWGEAGEKEIEFVSPISDVSIDTLVFPGHEKHKTLVPAKRVNDYWLRKRLVSVYSENYEEIYRGGKDL